MPAEGMLKKLAHCPQDTSKVQNLERSGIPGKKELIIGLNIGVGWKPLLKAVRTPCLPTQQDHSHCSQLHPPGAGGLSSFWRNWIQVIPALETLRQWKEGVDEAKSRETNESMWGKLGFQPPSHTWLAECREMRWYCIYKTGIRFYEKE